mgnify:FL=1
MIEIGKNAEETDMKLIAKLLCAAALTLLLCFAASAKEVVIYENSFDGASALSDFTVRGNWSVKNGAANLAAGKSSSGCLTYKIPQKYRGKKYKLEVDYLGQSGMGGLLIGADGEGLSPTPSYFFGYTASVAASGTKGMFAYFNEKGGWGDTLRTGLDTFDEKDVRLTAVVDPAKREILFTIRPLDGSRELFAMTYCLQTTENEMIYTSFSDTVGLRRAYTAKGSFDNFRVSVYEDDVMPAMSGSVTLSGLAFAASADAAVTDGMLTAGTVLSAADFGSAADFAADIRCERRMLFYFGMRDAKNGFAAEVNRAEETVVLYAVRDGAFVWLGERHVPVTDDFCRLRARVRDEVVSVWYDCYEASDDLYPLIELAQDGAAAGRFGVLCEDGEAKNFTVTGAGEAYAGKTFVNPVCYGADPDVLYHDGVYYLYIRKVVGDYPFTVYTSTDMVNWTERGGVYKWQKGWSSKHHFMSPNVFYCDGMFYLLFQAWNNDTDKSARLFYASAKSPLGPFEGCTMLHDVHEIGGHPFVDDDGKVYITLCRFDFGSNLYIEEVTVKDGVITPKPETCKLILYPQTAYEVNGRGRTVEGGVPWKHGGYYYMFYAVGSYKLHYGQSYAVSKSIYGPYEKYEYNPFLVYNAAVDGPGDAVILPSPDGEELYLVYHQHNAIGTVSPRMTCIDRLKFVPNPDGGPDVPVTAGPSSTPQPVPSGAAENPAAAAETKVTLTLGSRAATRNDTAVTLDAAPLSRGGRMMLPIRFVAEAFGAAVGWDGDTATATVAAGDTVITVRIGEKQILVNGAAVPLDTAAFIEGGRTYLPVRAVADALGAAVGWDGDTATATLTK